MCIREITDETTERRIQRLPGQDERIAQELAREGRRTQCEGDALARLFEARSRDTGRVRYPDAGARAHSHAARGTGAACGATGSEAWRRDRSGLPGLRASAKYRVSSAGEP